MSVDDHKRKMIDFLKSGNATGEHWALIGQMTLDAFEGIHSEEYDVLWEAAGVIDRVILGEPNERLDFRFSEFPCRAAG